MKVPSTFSSLVAAGVLSALCTTSAVAQDKADAKLLAKAKLTREQAQEIALKAVPGASVKEVELEEEDGGLRWSFDLKTPGTKNITEVGVDAVTGKIVENKVEKAKDEAKEKREEAGEKKD